MRGDRVRLGKRKSLLLTENRVAFLQTIQSIEEMSEKSGKKSGGCLKTFFILSVIVILVGMGGFFYLSNKGMDLTKEAFLSLFEGFKPKQVINTFTEWRDLQVESNDGNILEVATATATEEFSRETNFEMFGKILPISTFSKIDVPATYRYHIDLTGDWNMEANGNRLIVTPPPLQPSLPVAYDSGKMKKNQSGRLVKISRHIEHGRVGKVDHLEPRGTGPGSPDDPQGGNRSQELDRQVPPILVDE